MINGRVTAFLEPRIEVFVEDDTGHPYSIDAAIDTGYSGFMALPVGRTALIGTKMLAGQEVRMRFVDGGPVWIDVVP